MENKQTHRYIARFVVEAQTPLYVGSGEASLLKDAVVFKDVNGFPMIPGTSLAGVLRHSLKNSYSKINWNTIFGDTDTSGYASRIKVSSALMMLDESKCAEGILDESLIDKSTLFRYGNLPSRQHVSINDKGVAKKNGLFDNEIVYKGTRFVFEIELRGDQSDLSSWDEIVALILSPTFRLGSGTRNGYGSLKAIKIYNKVFNLVDINEFIDYINLDPSFNAEINWKVPSEIKLTSKNYDHYELELVPDSFFIFSEGFGDNEVDNKPLEEEIVIYSKTGISFSDKNSVIPASSIKGAIAHRVAYHYNKINNQYEGKAKVGAENDAVYELFGDSAGSKIRSPKAGNVFLNDLYYSTHEISNNKIFNHVAIDRFTGGAVSGALFSEKVSTLLSDSIKMSIYVRKDNYSGNVEKALENTIMDICKGLLPLGGMVTKGNGIFTGTYKKNGIQF